MIIRVQSEQGTKRLEVSETDQVAKLYKLAGNAFNLDPNSNWQLSISGKPEDALHRNSRSLIKTAKLK